MLKHVRDWSYETLSREVRANLVYRDFTRIGGGKVPDDRTIGNLARQLGPDVIENCIDGWSKSLRKSRLQPGARCGSIRR